MGYLHHGAGGRGVSMDDLQAEAEYQDRQITAAHNASAFEAANQEYFDAEKIRVAARNSFCILCKSDPAQALKQLRAEQVNGRVYCVRDPYENNTPTRYRIPCDAAQLFKDVSHGWEYYLKSFMED